ncbi:hypothetical protein [Streptosporangium saharense]|uniref:Outer membrane murein-binding lipoprotein Lpp n=1 Tax=Streptosporangium saharense TaxID=1706840 RepID=A0A7W7QWB9_9ACTN|nr:hypothetical protein [Streptosporangium saharense]MBB4920973.1 outer membrane murein-binding lipoprotein Lpp [Streptosporangium saharense]
MSEDYLGDIVGPAGDGGAHRGASDLPAVLTAVSAVSVDVGRLRARVDQLVAEQAAAARQVGKLGALPVAVASLQQRTTQLEQLAGEVAGLSAAVQQLADVGQGGKAGADTPPRPVDWVHVPPAERLDWMTDLAAWVRDVLMTGWPTSGDLLPPCWPHHRAMVNDLALLRVTYETAYDYEGGRAHTGGEFRRLLADVLTTAAAQAQDCPAPSDPRPHPVPRPPRDDTAAVQAVERIGQLGEVHALVTQANANREQDPALQAAAQARASELWIAYQITPQEYQRYESSLI